MGKRINIGIYIGAHDLDIAAWFNMLQDSGLSRSKWVQGLFCAYALNRPLPIGTVDPHASAAKSQKCAGSGGALFGTGSSQAEIQKHDRYGYGWQIRGPNREFIQGSVINVSVRKSELLPVLEESWKNGHYLATFLKSLIRENLAYGDRMIPPREEDLNKVYSAFLVRENKKVLPEEDTTRASRRRNAPRNAQKKIDISKQEPIPASAPAPFDFTSSTDGDADAGKHSTRGRNPLLSQI